MVYLCNGTRFQNSPLSQTKTSFKKWSDVYKQYDKVAPAVDMETHSHLVAEISDWAALVFKLTRQTHELYFTKLTTN